MDPDKPKPWMAESHTWAIADSVPDDGVIFEWGSGGSTLFWLEQPHVSSVMSMEHDEAWRSRVLEWAMKSENAGKLEVCCTNDLVEYTQGSFFPLDRADVILVDGIHRKLSAAYAATMAKEGAFLFLHDSEDFRYQWILSFLEKHPCWAKVRELLPLPEDSMQRERLFQWERIA